MKTFHYIFGLIIVPLYGCGAAKSTKGFFSDANVCRPIAPPDYNPIDILSGKFAIPAPTSGTVRTAQLTKAETETKNVWGAEIYLSSLLDSAANLKINPLVKRPAFTTAEIQTVGPDGASATQPFINAVQSSAASLAPSWVRVQFPGAITLSAGEAVWLIAEPDFSVEAQGILWWYTEGAGAYFAPANVPVYANVPNIQTVHRLIYCE